MKIYSNPPQAGWQKLCQRPALPDVALQAMISSVFSAVKKDGDQALRDFTRQFDGVEVEDLIVKPQSLSQAAKALPKDLIDAIDKAYENISSFHQAQLLDVVRETVETLPGVTCWREARPIEKVGLYIPGGTAPLISTLLMLGVPAQLAGCSEITVCTPPDKDGLINPAICYAASKIGATQLVKAGGAQSIAAMALGTETIGRVDKIFGPGNQYVTAAKANVQKYGVAIDMPAGPSEVLVIADRYAEASYVAADLLSQAEHGPDSQVVLLSDDAAIVGEVERQLVLQLAELPRRAVAEQALANSFAVTFNDIKQAIKFANQYAPEHLILNLKRAASYADLVVNAGSVFIGKFSPESAGDYASGTNHTLPTNGWARSYGGVSVDSFVKKVTFQKLTKNGLAELAPTIETLAGAEGLTAHARAVSIRLEK